MRIEAIEQAPPLTLHSLPNSGNSEIQIYLAHPQRCHEDLLERYRALMEPAEKDRASRFYFSVDRNRDLVTRALIRTVLSRYVAIAPQDLRFRRNAFGRPALSNNAPEAASLHFNLSHTAGLVVLAVTRLGEIGVDVEHWRARRADLDLADRFFAPVEAAQLRRAPVDTQQRLFFELWTLKEAYIKARGLGLSLDLASFAFSLPEEPVIDFKAAPSAHDPCRWRFWQHHAGPDHLIALCAAATASAPPSLSFRSVVPLVSETACDPTLIRESTCPSG